MYVSPKEDAQTPDAIEKAYIKRGDETIQPTTTTLAPVMVDLGVQGKSRLSKAFFAFPLDVFSPVSDITIVFVGRFGEVTCTLEKRELSTLQ